MTKFYIGKNTDIGNVKKINEDSLIIKHDKIINKNCAMLAVCDGLGGLSLGDVASKIAVYELEAWWNQVLPIVIKEKFTDIDILSELEKVVHLMNKKVIKIANDKNMKMGTTVSCLLIIEKKYYIAHIGDSRIYKFDSELTLLTQDHTYYESLRRQGLIEESKNVKKNILTQCVGSDLDISVYVHSGKINKSCTFMVCSDGYYNKMNIERTKNCLKFESRDIFKEDKINYICKDLVENVKSRGEKDNITLVIAHVDIKGLHSLIYKVFNR